MGVLTDIETTTGLVEEIASALPASPVAALLYDGAAVVAAVLHVLDSGAEKDAVVAAVQGLMVSAADTEMKKELGP